MIVSSTLPTGRRGRIVAVGFTLAVIFAVWNLAVSPLIDFYTDRADTLAHDQAVVQHMEQLVASRPALEARVSELGDAAAQPRNVLDGTSIPVATASLQGLVRDIATNAGSSLSSVESLPGETGAGYRRVGVRLALSTSWPVLIHFLQALQESDTPMAIDDLHIRSAEQTVQGGLPSFDIGFSIYAPASAEAPQTPSDTTPAAGDEPPPEAPASEAPAADAAPDAVK